jgi:ABC-type sugar transport system ATPase subunit
MPQPYLQMSGIQKSFPGVRALKGVDLEAYAGEALGLVGANGAGKSTLMNVLGGVVQEDAGEITIGGQPIAIRSPLEASERGIAFIHQELALLPTMTVVENIYIARFIKSTGPLLDFSTMEVNCAQALQQLGCDINPRAKIRELAAGERQLVEIARALLANARIIIFDEPTSSLTSREKENLFRVIGTLKEQRVTIVYITHFLDEIFDICERALVLRDGVTSGGGLCKDISHDQLVGWMIGETVGTYFREKRTSHGEPLLQVEGLSQQGVLDDISLTLHSGEVLGLWGLMGSGRTELSRALVGLDPIDTGTVRISTKGEAKRVSPREARNSIGSITENRREDGLILDASVRENISLANLRALISRVWPFIDMPKERALAQEMAERLRVMMSGLEQMVATLSGGNQQKVVVARWLEREPSAYIMDEPTRGLDVGAKAEIHAIISDLVDRGVGVLLISSEIEEMMGLSDRYLVMSRGRIVAEYGGDATKEELMTAAAGVQENG